MDFTIYKEMDNKRFTGTLQVSSDGTAGTGRSFTNYPVHIVRQIPGAKYPILLGDKYLGWCSESNLSRSFFRCYDAA